MLPVIIGIQRSWYLGASAYLLSDGFITYRKTGNHFDCRQAQVFLLENGRLEKYNQPGQPMAAYTGARYVEFRQFVYATITTSFSVVNGFLVWRNSTFYGGVAGFCLGLNGNVYATFTRSGGPRGCIPVYLPVYSGKSSHLEDLIMKR